MRLQQISSGINSHKKINNTAFKSRYTFDIGASDPRASLKILVQDNSGNDLFEYKGFVNDSTKGFEDNKDFIKKVARAVNVEELIDADIESIKVRSKDPSLSPAGAQKLKDNLELLKKNKAILQKRSAEEKKLTGFALLLPGTISEKTALFMGNVKKTDGTALEDVNLKKVISEVKKQGKVEIYDKFDLKKDFVPCKDLAGTGIGIATKVISHPEYGQRVGKGFYAVGVQTGGGFGAVDIKFKQDVTKKNAMVDIETNECGHDLYFDMETGKEKRLGKLGASTSSVIENYAKTLGITNSDDLKALVNTGKAEMATQKEIKLNSKEHEAAINVLTKTGVYEITGQNAEATMLKIKDAEKFTQASKRAINAYTETLARHAITRINRGANLYVISGPLAMGLNDRIKEAPEVFGEGIKDMRDLMFQKIDKYVGDDFTCIRLRRKNRFDIVCDRAMSLDNNTSGGSLLIAKSKVFGKRGSFARRGEWMSMPVKVLKEKGIAALKQTI